MINRSGTTFKGLSRLVRELQAMGVEVEDLKAAFSKIAAKGAQRAAQYAPHRTGRLAGDIRGNRAKSKASVISGRASIPYAGVQNYGWPARNIAPSLYLQKADEDLKPFALQMLEEEISNQLRSKGLK